MKYTRDSLYQAIRTIRPDLRDATWLSTNDLNAAAIDCFLYPEKWSGTERSIIRAALLDLHENGILEFEDIDLQKNGILGFKEED